MNNEKNEKWEEKQMAMIGQSLSGIIVIAI